MPAGNRCLACGTTSTDVRLCDRCAARSERTQDADLFTPSLRADTAEAREAELRQAPPAAGESLAETCSGVQCFLRALLLCACALPRSQREEDKDAARGASSPREA